MHSRVVFPHPNNGGMHDSGVAWMYGWTGGGPMLELGGVGGSSSGNGHRATIIRAFVVPSAPPSMSRMTHASSLSFTIGIRS